MAVNLPKAIADYFTADREHSETVALCFTPDAVVTDEKHTYNGRAAITQWKIDSSTKYTYTSIPLTMERTDGRTVVTSRVSGSFPGSPVDLRYVFELEGGKIASLEIAP